MRQLMQISGGKGGSSDAMVHLAAGGGCGAEEQGVGGGVAEAGAE